MKILLFVLLIIVSLFFIVLYLKSRKAYKGAILKIDKEEYSVKYLLPVGLYFMELINYKYLSEYDRKLYKKILRLKGKKQVDFYRLIHWAERVVYIFITLIIILFFSLFAKITITNIIFAILLLILSGILKDKELDQKLSEKYSEIRIEFAEFLSKFSLLVGAGLTTNEAFRRIAYTSRKDHPLYKEIVIVQKEIDSGVSFNKALENFALRTKMREISRFVSILVQNNLKGNENIVAELDRQAYEAFELRKKEAQIIGERVNSKVLFPMMIMLIAIMIILATPAMLILSNAM